MNCIQSILKGERLAGLSTWLLTAGLLVVSVGCSVSFTPQVLPNVKLDKLPNVTAGNVNGTNGLSLFGQSKQDREQSHKQLIVNLELSDEVVSGLRIIKGVNCAQLVELSTGAAVVDFSNEACPANNALIATNALRFTASYRLLRASDYELTYPDTSGMALAPIGAMRVDREKVTVTLLDLCHSSSAYQAYCLAELRTQRFWDIIMF